MVDFRSVTGALESLQGHGFIPDTMEEDASSSTTTLDEVAMPEENDPTSGLPEMKVAEAWVKHGPPPKGAGWWGRGAPIQVQQNYNVRDIDDGAGLCSPGRWHPSRRKLLDVGNLAKEAIAHMGLNLEEWSITTVKMMAGKLDQDPFPEDQLLKGRDFLETWCKDRGFPVQKGPNDVDQMPRLRLLQAFLRVCGDPDAEAIDIYCEGVRIGHKLKMPRTPAIYPKKDKWRIKYVDAETVEDQWAPNYRTARERLEVLESKVQEDVAEGRMKKMTFQEAKRIYGQDLLIGAMGLVDEGKEKFRLIHDGTHRVLINNRIRTLDHLPSPMVSDISAEMAEVEETGEAHLALVWDFKSAHRLVQVSPLGWGLQACTLADLRGKTPDPDAEM
jgi:hypothetical protein